MALVMVWVMVGYSSALQDVAALTISVGTKAVLVGLNELISQENKFLLEVRVKLLLVDKPTPKKLIVIGVTSCVTVGATLIWTGKKHFMNAAEVLVAFPTLSPDWGL